MFKLDFIFFDAGGGHRSAATALKAVAEQQERPWRVRLVNLQEILDEMDIFRKLTGIRLQDLYNRMLANGWTLGAAQMLAAMHHIVRIYHPKQVNMLARFWGEDTPDAVISLVPNFNRALFQGFKRVNPGGLYATILTDLADYPPHFWIEQQDQYFICGTEKALAQARGMGHPPEKTFLVSGMILRPAFYQDFHHDRAAEREKLGLQRDKPTGTVLFGGHGSPAMGAILTALQTCQSPLQLIMICGRNEKLAAELAKIQSRFPVHIVGFTQEVPYYMTLGDFFIGKPGPGSISEAIAMRLPVIIERNSWTLPQERYNAEWVLSKGLGEVVSNFRTGIAGAVDRMLAPGVLEQYKANARNVENRAIFEITDLLATLLERQPSAGG